MTETPLNINYDISSNPDIAKVFFEMAVKIDENLKTALITKRFTKFIDQHYSGRSTPDKFLSLIFQLQKMHPQPVVFEIISEREDNKDTFSALCRDQSENWFNMTIKMNQDHQITGFSASPALAPRLKEKLTEPEVLDRIRSIIDNEVEENDFAGNVLIGKGDEIILFESRGYRNQKLQIVHNENSLFNVGSMSKMFTATAIGYLVDHNKLHISQAIGSILKDIQLNDKIGEITIHQLLTHTSGLGNYWDGLKGREHEFLEIKKYEEFLTNAKLNPITDGINYSNLGFQVLGMIIERVSEQNYYDFIQNIIFKPLKMMDTGYPIFEQVDQHLMSVPFSDGQEVRWPTIRGSAAGGSVSTNHDLFRFFRGMIRGEILSEVTLEEFTTGKINISPDGSMKYAYGFGQHQIYDLISIGHNGGAPGINGDGRYLSNDYTIIVLANRDPGSAGKIVESFANLSSCL